MNRHLNTYPFLIPCSVFVFISACTIYKTDIPQGNHLEIEQINTLKVGMTREKVQQILGDSLLRNTYNSQRNDYVYRHTDKKGIVNQRIFTIFYDSTGKVLRWESKGFSPTHTDNKKQMINDSNDPVNTVRNLSIVPKDMTSIANQSNKIPQAITVVSEKTANQQTVASSTADSQTLTPVAMLIQPTASMANNANTAAQPLPQLLAIELIIHSKIKAWQQAWQTKSLATYSALYADGYLADTGSHELWLKQRQSMFDKSGDISLLNITDLNIIQTNENEARATFTQYYQSAIFKEVGTKQLYFQRFGDEWKIVAERFIKK